MRRLDAKVLVIGSGPGGATTTCGYAEAGHEVLLVEEGADRPVGSAEPYSLAEMDQKWRNRGLTPAFGPVKVTYVEGRCLGGASEVNAALYHPPVPELFDRWARERGLEDFDAKAMRRHVEAVEAEMSVSAVPGSPGIASERLAAGAAKLGWQSTPVRRFWKYDAAHPEGRRQSMTETLIPRARRAGARVEAGIRIRTLEFRGSRVLGASGTDSRGERVWVRCERVILAAGAVQTPLILRRSGIRRGIGDSLSMNPMIRVAAEFPDRVNQPELGVPVQQVEAFKPAMTLGCSHSSLAHLALWLVGSQEDRDRALAEWWRLGVFYAKVQAQTRGRVRNVPLVDEAFVSYPISHDDLETLGLAAERLATLLFAAGATSIVNPIPGRPRLTSLQDLPDLRAGVAMGKAQLSAIHLHSTVPLGGPVDGWGKLRGFDNVWINDSSLLPESPGINPQGTILAIARRNVEAAL